MTAITLENERALDGLRGVAIGMVLAVHANVRGIFLAGFLGVDVFFALSGYLITKGLVLELAANAHISSSAFIWRRAARLVPALYCSILMGILLGFLFSGFGKGDLLEVATGLFFGSNLLSYLPTYDSFAHGFGPLWSLSIEVQAYAMLFFIVTSIHRRGRGPAPSRIALLFGGIAVLSCTISILEEVLVGPDQVYYHSEARLGELALGGLVAVLQEPLTRRLTPRIRSGALAMALGLMALVGFLVDLNLKEGRQWTIYPLYPTALSAAIVILVCAQGASPLPRLARPLRSTVLVYLGQRSYGLYLYHWPIFRAIFPDEGTTTIQVALLGLGLTFVVTEVSFRLVERPARLRVKRWLARRREGDLERLAAT